MAAAGFGMAEERRAFGRDAARFVVGMETGRPAADHAPGHRPTCLVTSVLKQLLKCAAGRYWPESWTHHNPSLIGSGAYGFHPFHCGPAYESFPSGHAAVTCAIMAVLWASHPRWRWPCAFCGALLCVSLVGMNYHFVSDVIAGAMLGSITGVYTARLFGLGNAVSAVPQGGEGPGVRAA